MKPYIRIIRIPYEEPHSLNLIIEASNGNQKLKLEYYSNATDLVDIAKSLITFPRSESDDYLYELGSENIKDNFAHYLRFRVFTINPLGHCAIQLRINNNNESPFGECCDFCIEAEPAQVNRLGELFHKFSELKTETLEWSLDD
ncbi:MAG: hypothetical protein COA79_23320 [Planctomycetota bacterium]|nr:MAG: hypothetical protein COA79_23320 [Planctomycetota bacterium]